MTMLSNIRDRLAKRAAYNQTRFEIANMPTERAVEDLGIFPSDADKFASRAIYG